MPVLMMQAEKQRSALEGGCRLRIGYARTLWTQDGIIITDAAVWCASDDGFAGEVAGSEAGDSASFCLGMTNISYYQEDKGM